MESESEPDVAWVQALSGAGAARSEGAVKEAAAQRPLFRTLQRHHRRVGWPSYGEIDAPYELHALVRLLRPRHVVEVGVSSGVSSAYLLNALDLNGRGTLHSIDRPSRRRHARRDARPTQGSWSLPDGRGPGWAVPRPLRRRWDLREGDKADLLPLLADELPPVELFVYDVPHEDRQALREFRCLDPRLPPGAVAIVDHGPGGGLCPSLGLWAKDRGTTTFGRVHSGLHGMRTANGHR